MPVNQLQWYASDTISTSRDIEVFREEGVRAITRPDRAQLDTRTATNEGLAYRGRPSGAVVTAAVYNKLPTESIGENAGAAV